MSAHAIIAPSSLARTRQCPGSVVMEQAFPDTEQTPEAADGEASHWAAAELLAGRTVAEGQRAPNGVLLTQEMLEGADLYHDDVLRALQPFGRSPADGAIESPVAIPRVHSECWGTPDFRAWVPGPRPRLMLWDYKFGHRVVEVLENEQLAAYVAGCLSATRLLDTDADVEVRIVQPRAPHREGPVRRWAFRGEEIRALVNSMSNAAHEALGDNPRTRVGPECRDCRARHACPALQRAAMDACDVAGQAQPFALGPGPLGVELRTLRRHQALLAARITGLEEQVEAAIRAGLQVPHWRVEFGTGRRRWTRPAAEVIAMGQMLGVDLAKPAEAITPVQAVKAGLPASMLDPYTETPRGAATVVPDDGSKARVVFGGSP